MDVMVKRIQQSSVMLTPYSDNLLAHLTGLVSGGPWIKVSASKLILLWQLAALFHMLMA